MRVSRRRFIKALSILGLGVTVQPSGLALVYEGEKPLLRSPQKVGSLTSQEKDQLWLVFQHIGELWQSSQTCLLDHGSFVNIVDLKTEKTPSYLTEYRTVLAHLQTKTKVDGEKRALADFFAKPPDQAMRTHVLAELIELHLIHGGFRAFGLQNYRGFMGGPFARPAPLPYRGREAP